ncbi:MFS transporter [Paraburkholderia ginsengiterrae]|uniref:MFS transporter n=1 Tax=Paraburkholderia ginsengiterrae TaxID=1462993 RepID=A0A1A9N538_9BURK|nr:MFS transporter [Paraburkholderia ginsengiterrae]OAJ57362.1 MFS transporter [Paraburkholderia ginsengiterrae]OAJ58963.1 MFS transporter [Paraburkholderia ginsengiterrae]
MIPARPLPASAVPVDSAAGHVVEDTVFRKISWRVMPLVLIAYVFAFLDRINIGYAQLQMKQDLAFSDAVYGLGAGIFFVTYLLFEVPSNLLLEKIGARLTFLRIMVLWGIASAATAFVTAPWHFYVIRMLLGLFEAGFFPGIILYLTYWYPSQRRGRVTGLFLFGMPITGVLGGPLSGTIMSGMEGLGGMHGWQWLFLVEGLPTVLLGFVLYRMLPNGPARAPWLNTAEKVLVQSVLDADHRGEAKAGHQGRLAAALADPKTYVLAFVYFCCACAVYTLTFWLPTMIKGLGIAPIATIGWYTAVPYIFGALGVLVISRSSDRFKERRWHVGGTLVLGAVALASTSFLGAAVVPVMVLLSVASFCIFGGGSLFWSIPPTYLGRDAAAAGIAVISSLGILGGFVSPTLIGWIKSATGSIQIGLLGLIALVIGGGLTILLGLPKSAVRVGPGENTSTH